MRTQVPSRSCQIFTTLSIHVWHVFRCRCAAVCYTVGRLRCCVRPGVGGEVGGGGGGAAAVLSVGDSLSVATAPGSV